MNDRGHGRLICPRRPPVDVLHQEGPFLELSEPHRADVEVPQPIVDLLEADVWLAEHMADVDPGAAPADAAVAADAANLEVVGVIDRWTP